MLEEIALKKLFMSGQVALKISGGGGGGGGDKVVILYAAIDIFFTALTEVASHVIILRASYS